MNEDLKYGEKYRLELLCKSQTKNIIVFETPTGDLLPLSANDLECVSPIPERENPETSPKYDPCRLFKEGDIVEPCQVNGRWSTCVWRDRAGIRYKVTKDEDPLQSHMEVKDPDSPQPFLVHAAFFKLVTPVEDMGPYSADDNPDYFYVVDARKETSAGCYPLALFSKRNHPNAKAAAEAERDRLNAEYRKEQK